MTINFFSCLPNNNYECISLGESCTVSAALQAFGLRNASYPFDWAITPYKSLCQVFEQDFHNFFDSSAISIHSDNRAIINKYGLIFTHDFPIIFYPRDLGEENPASKDVIHPDWINVLPEVQKKYNRRIQRLRDICTSDKKIYFIRHRGITSCEQACTLRNIIKEKYPNLDFTIIVVGKNPNLVEPWEEQNIRNYYLEDKTTWNDVAQWENIFIDLGLYNNKMSIFLIPYIKRLFHKH